MEVAVAPVSGSGFPAQLAAMGRLFGWQYCPTLFLSASGGTLASYVAMASNLSESQMLWNSSQLYSGLMFRSWGSTQVTSLVTGFVAGAGYDKGPGPRGLFERFFGPGRQAVGTREIWSCTYNRTQGKAVLFCNRSQSNSILAYCGLRDTSEAGSRAASESGGGRRDGNGSEVWNQSRRDVLGLLPPVYCNGNLDDISDYTMASVSIPTLIGPQIIDGQEMVDGGLAFASPMTPLKSLLMSQPALHITYINSFNMNEHRSHKPPGNLLQMAHSTARILVCAMLIQDRVSGIDIVQDGARKCGVEQLTLEEFPLTYEYWQRVQRLKGCCGKTLLEIYPAQRQPLDITNFQGPDVVRAIQGSNNLRARFWYW
jgi:hypothetical protein